MVTIILIAAFFAVAILSFFIGVFITTYLLRPETPEQEEA